MFVPLIAQSMKHPLLLRLTGVVLFIVWFAGCRSANEPVETPSLPTMYFPPATGAEWQTITPATLGWNVNELPGLTSYLEQKKTKAFIILKNGSLAFEQYFGTFTADSLWYWASAGKTMTAMLVGIAQQEGLLNINHRTSQYLGAGWTSLPAAKEQLITIRHQLTMTTGLDDGVPDDDCTQPSCLQYKADAGNRWAYHNAPYTLLDKVVEKATSMSYNAYFQQKIRNPIVMNGAWIKTGYNNVYFSNARSMARFGLLLLNKGIWNQTRILTDSNYVTAQMTTSQNFNPSYGYLTWLNGKSSYMLPTLQTAFSGALVLNAPPDMVAALGKNDQKIYVVPSQNLVVIRMGETSGQVLLAASSFDNELWGKLKTVLRY